MGGTCRHQGAGAWLPREADCSPPRAAASLERVSEPDRDEAAGTGRGRNELGGYRLGRHSAAELDPGLDDFQLAEALVREAGTLALLMRQAGLEGRQKTSISDVVTAADHAAEAYVLDQLRRCRPEDGILGEEGASVAGSSGRTWVIDPVDGTYNFLHGSTYWCSALALKAAGEVVLGAIFQPEEDKLWLGGTSRAATLNGERLTSFRPGGTGGESRSETPVAELSAATYIHPGWLADPMCAMPWHAAATSAATLRMFGSGSCDLGRVADGGVGCWFQHSCPEWDWLPGKAIVLAAGGAADVVRVNGLEWFIAGGTTAVQQLRAALESGSVG
ncbi:inositol monophosphatase family protein [Arthrobacter sp. PAMC25284]|nr:inositol monophosphatase family protein [Arthrobacter sp. PAMC25284]